MKKPVLMLLSMGVWAGCQATTPCESIEDCGAGEQCIQNECRATNVGGGTGAGGGAGGAGGGSTIVTGCNPDGGVGNQFKDTDCDGLSDAEEYVLHGTDPCNSDSDADGLSDGVELGKVSSPEARCSSFVGDANPATTTDPKNPDTDGDGLKDGAEDKNANGRVDPGESSPNLIDSDCDGYSDADELAGEAGCATDPLKRDTDGDGLSDGVEGGLIGPGADPDPPGKCVYVANTFDSDPTTTTDACNADTDGDGVADGSEDTNQNGRLDPGELNPADASDVTPTVTEACGAANLKPITFHFNADSDVQLALEPSFAEVNGLSTEDGDALGFAFYDAPTKVAGFALSKVPEGGVAEEELLGRTRIDGVSNPLIQTFTTWDGFSALRAIYDVSGGGDAKAKVNTILTAYGAAAGQLTGAAGSNGPFKVVAEYVRRSANRAVVVVGLVPASLYTGQALFRVNDAAGGTALAQFGDFANTQCEVFDAAVNAEVDFLWVVDDSCSMRTSQNALANASALFGDRLTSAGLDWRAAGVSTGCYGGSYGTSCLRDWTSNVTTMRSWFLQSSGAGVWWGEGGSGSEQGFESMTRFLNDTSPPPGPLRTSAQTHVLFLTDTREHSSVSATTMRNTLNAKGTARVVAHGILCPDGISCASSELEDPVSKYGQLISATGGVRASIQIFNPTSPTAQQEQQQADTIDAILNAVIGGTGTQLQRPPISATIKVAVASTRGTCNASDVPRSRENGWDIDPATRRLVFFGNCIPSASGVQVAVSYKYWSDGSPDPDGTVCAPPSGGCAVGTVWDAQQCACVIDIG